ncbi:MAG TPA: hypothetical protein ENO24_09780 [Chloroflexi bacterium]|nr:hypothetical protein [Chloroflexota bacterium]
MARRTELQNEFSWSLSRDFIFHACLRQYYYHYYGSWGGWRHEAPPDVKELYVMKNLQTTPMWTGSIVHQIAHEVVKGFRTGQPLSVEAALATTRDRMERDWQDSATCRYRRRPNRICGLAEHYYAVSIPAQALAEAAIVAQGCVRRLYGSHTYKTMLELGPDSIVECEELNTISVAGVKGWVSPDLILRDGDERLMVVDWKTGTSSQKEETTRQLSIYALYALRKYSSSARELMGVEENLRLGESHLHSLKEWALQETREYVEGSIQKMRRLLHDEGQNIALIRDFPMTDHLAACLHCRFRRACDRG